MSTKVKKKTYLIESGDMSSDITSSVQENFEVMYTTVYIWWSGTSPVGTVSVFARVNPEKEKTPIYQQLTLSSSLVVTGNTGSLTVNFNAPLGQWYIKYNATSGTGTMNATWEGRSE